MYRFDLADDERIVKKDRASLQLRGELYSGALYLTTTRLVFVGYLLDIDSKCMHWVFFNEIASLEREKTFYVVPNVLSVKTDAGEKLKIVVNKRNEWYEEIRLSMRRTGGKAQLLEA